ncbi:MAG: hypothetical protein ACWGQW_23270, partial [bacterium]
IPPVTEETPQFRNITLRNIICRGAQEALYLQGLPEMNLENVIIENMDVKAVNGLTCIDSKGITIDNLRLDVDNLPPLRFINCSDVNITNLVLAHPADTLYEAAGNNSHNITIETVTGDGEVSITRIE